MDTTGVDLEFGLRIRVLHWQHRLCNIVASAAYFLFIGTIQPNYQLRHLMIFSRQKRFSSVLRIFHVVRGLVSCFVAMYLRTLAFNNFYEVGKNPRRSSVGIYLSTSCQTESDDFLSSLKGAMFDLPSMSFFICFKGSLPNYILAWRPVREWTFNSNYISPIIVVFGVGSGGLNSSDRQVGVCGGDDICKGELGHRSERRARTP